jgi:MarR-like DNA-binding transcriptional regulator SgrR of sgrS sRNA
MKHYSDGEKLAMADAPILPLFYEQYYRLLQPTVRDCALNAMGRYDMKYVWFDDAK